MAGAGKGSALRPRKISDQEWSDNHNRIFGNKPNIEQDEQNESDKSNNVQELSETDSSTAVQSL